MPPPTRYPELTKKERKTAVIDPPPLFLRQEEVYVVAVAAVSRGDVNRNKQHMH